MGSPSWSLRGARRLMRGLCLSAADQTATSRVYQPGRMRANRPVARRLGSTDASLPPDHAPRKSPPRARRLRRDQLHRSAPAHHEPRLRPAVDRLHALGPRRPAHRRRRHAARLRAHPGHVRRRDDRGGRAPADDRRGTVRRDAGGRVRPPDRRAHRRQRSRSRRPRSSRCSPGPSSRRSGGSTC